MALTTYGDAKVSTVKPPPTISPTAPVDVYAANSTDSPALAILKAEGRTINQYGSAISPPVAATNIASPSLPPNFGVDTANNIRPMQSSAIVPPPPAVPPPLVAPVVPPGDTATPSLTGNASLDAFLKQIQGGTGTTYNAPDTTSLDAQITAAQAKANDTAGIDSALAAKLAQIDAQYANEEKNIRQQSADSQAADFSNLAGVGAGFNPLSSGGKSVANANAATLDKFLTNLNMRKQAETAASIATAQGQKNEAAKDALAGLMQQRDTLKSDATAAYERDRQKVQDTISELNSAASLASQFDPSQKDMARNSSLVSSTFDMLGSKAFDGSTPEALALMEKSAGLPAGYVAMAKKALAEKERSGVKVDNGELRDIGGNLYQITYDENGNAIPRLIQGKTAAGLRTGGGGSGASGATGEATSPGLLLSPAEKKTINSSSDAATLKAIQNLNDLLNEYETVVKDVGVETFGSKEKQRLDQLQGLMTVEYKNLAQLGALSGPDMGLVASITPNATTKGFFEGLSRAIPVYSQLISGKTQGNVLANIENLRKLNQKKIDNAEANLTTLYSGKENDPYIRSLLGKPAQQPQGETMVLNGVTYIDDGSGNFVPVK